jgi:outer membrane protein OmpA-like peptidoglycan-associated protein
MKYKKIAGSGLFLSMMALHTLSHADFTLVTAQQQRDNAANTEIELLRQSLLMQQQELELLRAQIGALQKNTTVAASPAPATAGKAVKTQADALPVSPVSVPDQGKAEHAAQAPHDADATNNKTSYLFAPNCYKFTPDKATTEKLLSSARSSHKIVITGFTDSSGSATLNKQLSHKRALAVLAFFVSHGFGRDVLKAQGALGGFVASNDTAANRALNRRADISFA